MKQHDNIKPYACTECSKSFTHSSHLAVHKRIHTGEKPYKCRICGDGFISSNHLKRHMKTHSNHLPFACGTYKQAFSQRRQLVSHCEGKVMLQAHKFQEHHENPDFETSSFPEDKFACRVCLKLLTRNSDIKAHILRVHCGDCRYPCTMCGKRFKESTHLRKHLYTHTGERPRYCSLSVRKVFRQALI